MRNFLYLFFAVLLCHLAIAQQPETFPVNGTYDQRDGLYAFTNATVYIAYNKKIEKATLLIRNGKVEQVGANLTIPKNAVKIDLKGKFIYPAFIDLYSNYGLPEAKRRENRDGNPQMESDKKGAYGWNEAIRPETQANALFDTDAKAAKSMRQLGFAAALTHLQDGIARGSGAVVLLGNDAPQQSIIKGRAAAHYSFDKGTSTQNYPESLMGSIALLRQTYLDAKWYEQSKGKTTYNLSLDNWNNLQNLPQIFDAGDKQSVLRADKIGDEFGIQYIFKTQNDAYQRINEIKATNASLIVPINLPDAYNIENPLDAANVDLSDMMHWEQAASNLAMLEKAGINFAITASGLKNPSDDFYKNLQLAIKRGLSKETALKALTATPAALVGMTDQLGSLENGKFANFIIASGDIFDEKTDIFETWVKGKRYNYKALDVVDVRGKYRFTVGSQNYNLSVKGDKASDAAGEIVQISGDDTTKIVVKIALAEQNLSISFVPNPKDSTTTNKTVRLSGWTSPDGKEWKGTGQTPDGAWINWNASQTAIYKPDEKKEKEEKEDNPEQIGSVRYPFNGYGFTEVPQNTATVLFKNATVWTNEKDGILQNTDVLIKDGKIAQIGKDITAPAGAKTIDATNKHLTCGIIDEHSHIAISAGVNEGSKSCSSEVRIGDVVDAEDINIYRQLAGGVTTSQLLHGSANAIGGQSGLIKLRWGASPEKMKFENADPFIKFALGENVKQSNWGDNNTIRFPQTRMGVEQVYLDYFTRAKEYDQALKGIGTTKKGAETTPLRRNLELEALAEIINKKRFITCHSYVQSEITMLMRVAEQFGFTVNTFTHILEGYKIADKMKEHGVNASTFSDWWAYKYEVIDAIPYNGAILHDMGVNVGFNSDDAEMARRLNQEAAKAVKYGKVSEEEAWKFVTLNPAKMLHIDKQVGSVKVGKDADVVLWNNNPLAIYAKPEKTFVDGICLFDIDQDKKLRQFIQDERNRIAQKMLKAKQGGAATQDAAPQRKHLYHCNDHQTHSNDDYYSEGDHSEEH